ncbi:large ribosomal subunit protein mL44-like [Diadema setosum]|uniref:large ribosomal subunit protein mL44-like n=1 Tax=Diadema setosum TaxID=31175 RepID=UPI003B3A1D2D
MAASMHARVSHICKGIFVPLLTGRLSPPHQFHVRHHARWLKPFLFALGGQLKFLRIKYGEEPKKPRSHQDNWDYTSEIYAFGQRFGEQFNDATIRTAFTHRSYVEKEEAHRKEMGLLDKDSQLQLEDNSALSQTGYLFSSSYVKSYLRHSLPKVPEEGQRAIHQYLLSGNVLSHVAGNLGMRDLILCADFPVPSEILEMTFMAIIGALLEDQGPDRAGLFVRDFLLPQLMDKDLCEIWRVDNPMGVVTGILEAEGKDLPESRLMREAGKSTITPLFIVGVYSNKRLLGWAPGESISAAEEEAAYVALRNLLDIPEKRPPLPLDGVKHSQLHQRIVRELDSGRTEQQKVAAS